jgi:beta-glucosidase
LKGADKSVANVKVSNTGNRDGAQVVQIYVQPRSAESFERRLAGFAKVSLKAGESAAVEVALEPLAFKHYKDGWQDLEGEWIISLAENASEKGSSLIV